MAYRLSLVFGISLLVCWVQSQNTNLACPNFEENTVVTLDLEVVNSSFSASCDAGPTTVTCYFQPPNGAPSTVCIQSVKQCETTISALGCQCVRETGTGYIYALQFKAEESKHLGGIFSCGYDCTIITPGKTPPPVDIEPDCLTITIAPPDTSAPGCPICKKGTDCDKPDWICLLFLLLLIPIVILIIILWYFFVHKPKTGDICGTMNAEEGGPKGSPQNQQTSNGTKPAHGKGSSQSQQTTNGNRTVDGRGSTQNQQTTNGNKTADGKRARNGEKVSKPVQETELTKVQETSSAPSGVKETSLNGTS